MPRQSRTRSAPAPRSAPAQTRGAHTAAAPVASSYPAAHAPAPPTATSAPTAQTKQPGMLAQMAATAGSVAVGSTIGHGISSMLFGGGGSNSPPVQSEAPPVQQQQDSASGINCQVQAKEFTQCLEKADLPSCTWYLEQLKACQAAAAPY